MVAQNRAGETHIPQRRASKCSWIALGFYVTNLLSRWQSCNCYVSSRHCATDRAFEGKFNKALVAVAHQLGLKKPHNPREKPVCGYLINDNYCVQQTTLSARGLGVGF
ncbi:hypothetical protein OAN307_63p00460 (plasmid) [Octadecabacter antarcticus 307]|uniref:Uncharacterized protein n=1 Tax=Octadecabacter antarcticus 307 TaxID=391626 RepID=M9RCC4_9RHOB|nr:hypothetical protein OAN307_63p00460 [Octadecabacter antarcticus 307]